MKAIKYVGKKPQRSDSVADTGLVWKAGQVHVVTDAVASRLLQHPDCWAEVQLETAVAEAGRKPDVTDSKPKPVVKDEMTPFERVNTRDMSLNELRDYARSHLSETLPPRITEETARRKVNDLLKVHQRRTRES